MSKRHYAFSWDLIGDIQKGRPHLGNETRLEIYRLFQFTVRDVLEQHVGKQENLYAFLASLQKKLLEYKIGILRVEQGSKNNAHLLLSVEEDLDCSGLAESGEETCHYDEGFLKGALDFQTGDFYNVKEVDCWCLGGKTCRFEAIKTNEEK